MFKIYQTKISRGCSDRFFLSASFHFSTPITSFRGGQSYHSGFQRNHSLLEISEVMEDLNLFVNNEGTSFSNEAVNLFTRKSQIPHCSLDTYLETESQTNPFSLETEKQRLTEREREL